MHRISYKIMCQSAYWQRKVANGYKIIFAVFVYCTATLGQKKKLWLETRMDVMDMATRFTIIISKFKVHFLYVVMFNSALDNIIFFSLLEGLTCLLYSVYICVLYKSSTVCFGLMSTTLALVFKPLFESISIIYK